jgi:hypothetical protein
MAALSDSASPGMGMVTILSTQRRASARSALGFTAHDQPARLAQVHFPGWLPALGIRQVQLQAMLLAQRIDSHPNRH